MGTQAEPVSQTTTGSGQLVELLLPGYPDREADRLLSILNASGQPARLHQSREGAPAVRPAASKSIHVVVIHLDHLPTAPHTITNWVRKFHPQARIIFASNTPVEYEGLAEELEIGDLIDSRDYLRTALAVRRSYRRWVSRRERPRSQALPGIAGRTKPVQLQPRGETERPTPEPTRARSPESSNATPQLHALFRPLVSLDGDSRAHYLIRPFLLTNTGSLIQPASSVECQHLCGQPSEIDGWLVEQAADKLAELQGKAGLHLAISEKSLGNETLLLRTCESLRRFNVRGSNLYFDFDAALLKEESQHFLRFLSGLRKVNCHISCSNVDDTHGLPALLSRYDVHMAQFAESTVNMARDRPDYAERLVKTNLEIQRRGIKTLAGNIGDPAMLALLWQLGVNYVWGDFLHTPLIHRPR